VIGHEVAHVANGDMVTMTLIQGVMNTFVVFLSRVIGYAVDSFLRKGDDRGSRRIGLMTTIVLDICARLCRGHRGGLVLASARFRATLACPAVGRKQPMVNALAPGWHGAR